MYLSKHADFCFRLKIKIDQCSESDCLRHFFSIESSIRWLDLFLTLPIHNPINNPIHNPTCLFNLQLVTHFPFTFLMILLPWLLAISLHFDFVRLLSDDKFMEIQRSMLANFYYFYCDRNSLKSNVSAMNLFTKLLIIYSLAFSEQFAGFSRKLNLYDGFNFF